MAGLLDKFFGTPDQTQALGLLGAGMMNGGFAKGAPMAMQYLSEAPQRQRQGLLQDMQIQNLQSEMMARDLKAKRDQAELERQAQIRQKLPSLFRQPGMTGGEAVPQTFGGTDIPMFSKPVNAAPMQATPGGFDVMGAMNLGMDPESIKQYAGLQDLGRPKATRQMEVDDGHGGKRIALVDDFGREVAGFAGYTAPVQVNQGYRVSFVKPAPGVSMPVGMSPDARASNALGWANYGLSKDRLTMDKANAGAGPKLTEDQGKATGWLVQAENAYKNMLNAGFAKGADGTLQVKDAARPGVNDALERLPLIGPLANTMRGADRQKFMQASSSLSEALLRAATGAGVNADEARQKIQELTPRFGESDEATRQKMAAIPLYLETLRVRAGPGARSAAGVLSQGSGGAEGSWGPTSAGNDPLGLRR